MRLHEIEFVDRLRRLAKPTGSAGSRKALRLRHGIGDDCAVLSANASTDLLITTDLFIEDVHFRRAWQSAHSVGHKVLTRGLSDIAAMGGSPRFAFLSLALPRATTQRWVDNFLDGFLALAKQHHVVLVGGDTGSSPHGFLADIIVVGEVLAGSAILRSGARAGDEIWVTGQLGGAAAELSRLRNNGKAAVKSSAKRRAGSNPYFYPQARVEIGASLRTAGVASAMMDISDGLSTDLLRLTQASDTGAIIEEAAIPRAAGATLSQALHGGDDFELLFTVRPGTTKKLSHVINNMPLTRIGTITKHRGLRLTRKGVERPLTVRGYQHF
jgi:thiamine-monophosphate kinase